MILITAPGEAATTASELSLYNLTISSPGQTFVGTPLFLAVDVFATGASAPAGLLPEIHVGTDAVFLFEGQAAPGPLGAVVLPAQGASLSILIPLGTSGTSVIFQGGVFPAPQARNGVFAATDAHILEVR